jgi:metallo-beta-lactamase family protein
MGYNASPPYIGTMYDVATTPGGRKRNNIPCEKGITARRADNTFHRLISSGKRLLEVIERNRGGANKDLARFASQIDSLSDKWDR